MVRQRVREKDKGRELSEEDRGRIREEERGRQESTSQRVGEDIERTGVEADQEAPSRVGLCILL